jgi:predicted sulfurtransferase
VPFKKLFIKKKKEIIPFGVPTVDATERLAPYLTPEQLKQWFLDGREFVLLDTRNTYEIEKGTFENAKHLNLQHFKNFPQALEKRSEEFKGKPVVMFCTGGIRCEKAAVYAKDLGLDAWQLEGGILNYFERVGSLGYKGDCFVFDERSALDPALKQSK